MLDLAPDVVKVTTYVVVLTHPTLLLLLLLHVPTFPPLVILPSGLSAFGDKGRTATAVPPKTGAPSVTATVPGTGANERSTTTQSASQTAAARRLSLPDSSRAFVSLERTVANPAYSLPRNSYCVSDEFLPRGKRIFCVSVSSQEGKEYRK